MDNELIQTTLRLPPHVKILVTDQLDVVVMERHQLPSVTFKLIIWGNTAGDPEGKEGLCRLTAKLLKKGAGPYSADKFAYAVESRGATVSVQTNYDYMTISGEFLSKDADFGLYLIATMLLEPRFSSREISFLKKKTTGEITSILDEPGRLCGILHNRNLFQKHPYGRPLIGNRHSIKRLNKKDIIDTHQQKMLQSRMLLTVVGDVKSETIAAKAKELFSDLMTKPLVSENDSSLIPIKGRTIFMVNKADQTQAHIRIGNIGIARSNPVFHKLVVTNTFFGGRFTSRLMTEIRVNRGLTYGIRSGISAYRNPGPVTISTFTKTASTALAVGLIYKEIYKLRSTKISESELGGTKRYLTGLYPLTLETNKRLAQHLSDIYFYGLSLKTIEEFPGKITVVSVSDVQKTARRYYSESDTVVTVLGDVEKIAPEMEKLGMVVRKDVADFGLTAD